MASARGRRSRTLDSDDDESRPNTPASNAPYDSKRIKKNHTLTTDESDDDSSEDETHTKARPGLSTRTVSTIPSRAAKSGSPSGHQPGAIVRVKLTNFVTYTAAEFFPGPNLNMVIGPNGTGKSTLVCAICLGLGWPPKWLGRSKDPADFVKHGAREATIKIELQRKSTTSRNPVITRRIQRENNQSTYFLWGKQSSGREVQHLANSFNIQIDNLCQFLPQDKVVEFAQLNPMELLTSTVRAVAGPEMLKYQEDLKKVRAEQIATSAEDKGRQEQLTNFERRQALQEAEVVRLRERAKVQLRLQRLEQCRILVEYLEAKGLTVAAKKRADEVAQELKHLQDVSAPTMARVTSRKEYETEAKTNKAQLEADLTACLEICDMRTKDITNLDSKIQEQKDMIQAEKTGAASNKEKIRRAMQKLQEYQRKKREAPESFDVSDIKAKLEELKSLQRDLQREHTELAPKRKELSERGNARKTELIKLKAKLEAFGSHAQQQDEKLKQLSSDTSEAWEWIKANRDQFSQHVYGPPIVECSLKDPKTADAVESTMQKSDFKIITAQNRADFNVLQKKLSAPKAKEGLGLHDVSLRECNIQSLEQCRPPLAKEEMERLGLSGWVLDMLQGPEIVLAQLCQERFLHRCGLSSSEPSQHQHDELAQTEVSSYVAGQKVYQFLKRKEYGSAGTSTRVQDVRRAQYWTDQPIDMGRKTVLEQELNEANGEAQLLQTEYNSVKERQQQLQAEKTQAEKEIKAHITEKDAIQLAKSEYDALDVKIQTIVTGVENLRSTLRGTGERIEEIQEKIGALLLEKTTTVLGFSAAAKDVKASTARLLEAEIILIEANSDVQVAEAQNADVVQGIEEKQGESDTLQQTLDEQRRIALRAKKDAMKVKAEAEKLANEGDESFLELLEDVSKSLRVSENLEAEIDTEKAKLELTEGGNASAIAEFEHRADVIKKLQAAVEESNQKRIEFKHSIDDIRGRWEPRLDEYVAQINDAFSDSFARIGCAGQVAVHKASSSDAVDCTEENGGVDNGLDFANWAIHISVKFRELEPLSLLDSHRQSGGERAVSTIFYLMALQSLSRAPFRVVDEINQGMDPRNERMVHGRMVDIAADDGGSQYFLITPKLLSGLKYRRGMTVLCIVSGENVPAARQRDENGDWQDGPKVDFASFVKRAKELGIGRSSTTGRRIDSGLGLGATQSTPVGA